jgi:hypothetical protein
MAPELVAASESGLKLGIAAVFVEEAFPEWVLAELHKLARPQLFVLLLDALGTVTKAAQIFHELLGHL